MHETFRKALVLLACGLAVGCGYDSVPLERRVESARGLEVEVGRPADLLSVNTVSVDPIEAEPSIDPGQARRGELYSKLVEAVSAEANFPVLAADDPASRSSDAVLRTTINQFADRVGSRVGAMNPARLDFTMRLLRRSDGAEVWRAGYHFSDQALTDNLFAIGRTMEGGSLAWNSMNDISAWAFRAAARDLASRRLAQFSGEPVPQSGRGRVSPEPGRRSTPSSLPGFPG